MDRHRHPAIGASAPEVANVVFDFDQVEGARRAQTALRTAHELPVYVVAGLSAVEAELNSDIVPLQHFAVRGGEQGAVGCDAGPEQPSYRRRYPYRCNCSKYIVPERVGRRTNMLRGRLHRTGLNSRKRLNSFQLIYAPI
jgi:ferredoxin-thioredoxin reductase catalytic subunit